jgi:hypothetical protein
MGRTVTPSVFARIEEKYLISYATADTFVRAFGAALVPDEYGETSIRNLYLDTPERLLIRRSMEKPRYKEKLRIRTYGTVASDEHPAFLELKKKFNGQVYKRRARMTLDGTRRFLAASTGYSDAEKTGSFPLDLTSTALAVPAPTSASVASTTPAAPAAPAVAPAPTVAAPAAPAPAPAPTVSATSVSITAIAPAPVAPAPITAPAPAAPLDTPSDLLQRQILQELGWSLKRYAPLHPFMSIHYQRCGYTCAGLTGDVRITIDCDVTWASGSWEAFFWREGDARLTRLLRPQTCIMEIKTLGALPLELTALLSELRIFPTSFSKVGRAYTAALLAGKKQGGEATCSRSLTAC